MNLAEATKPYPGSVTWSGDGTLVAAVIGADGVVIWSAADGVVRKRYRMTARSVAFAHHGERLAFASTEDAGVIDLRADCARRFPQRGPLLAWSSDDRTIFVGGVVGERPGIVSMDPATGALLRQWAAPENSPRFVSMDVSAEALAIADEFHVVRTVSPDLSRARTLAGAPNAIGNARAVAIAPNGKLVASAVVEEIPVRYPADVMPGPSSDHKFFVRIVSLPDGDARTFPGDPEALAFSPDGNSLAIAGTLDSRLVIRTMMTNETRVLDARVSFPQQIAWAPDGRSLALADWRGAIRLYDASGASSPRILEP